MTTNGKMKRLLSFLLLSLPTVLPIMAQQRVHVYMNQLGGKWDFPVVTDSLNEIAFDKYQRQVLMNVVKNAIEAKAHKIVVRVVDEESPSLMLYVGNDGLPIPAENRQSLFVPFFTTKRSGSGIGLSLSRRMMIQQGGMLDLTERQYEGCCVGFMLTLQVP